MWYLDKENNLKRVPNSKSGAQVWVPGEEMVFHEIDLPLNRRHAWPQLAPFALEEKLIGDIEDFHFAVGTPNDNGQVPAMTIAREKMDMWMEIFNDNSLRPEKIWPDILAVPYDEQPVLWHEEGRCLLRLDAQTGLAGSPEWLGALIKTQAESFIKIKVYSNDAEALPESLRQRVEALPRPLIECMAEAPHAPAAAMNMLQGSYRPSSPLKTWLEPWMGATAAGLLGLSFYLALSLIHI